MHVFSRFSARRHGVVLPVQLAQGVATSGLVVIIIEALVQGEGLSRRSRRAVVQDNHVEAPVLGCRSAFVIA